MLLDISITNAKLMYSLHSAEKKNEFEQIIDNEINVRNIKSKKDIIKHIFLKGNSKIFLLTSIRMTLKGMPSLNLRTRAISTFQNGGREDSSDEPPFLKSPRRRPRDEVVLSLKWPR